MPINNPVNRVAWPQLTFRKQRCPFEWQMAFADDFVFSCQQKAIFSVNGDVIRQDHKSRQPGAKRKKTGKKCQRRNKYCMLSVGNIPRYKAKYE